MIAIRTQLHCKDESKDKSKEVDVDFKLFFPKEQENTESSRDVHVYIIGGPTGYESISLKNLKKVVETEKNWCACAGTRGSWNKMVIPARSCKHMLVLVESALADMGLEL